MELTRGVVVRSTDPFKLGTDRQRPWLIVSDDRHPFHDEQVICVAISTKRYDLSIRLTDSHWVMGGVPEPSYASPWAVHSPRIEDFVAVQGRLSDQLTRDIVDALVALL